MSKQFRHLTVLLREAVEALITEQNGCYVDGTFGRGGHSRLVLAELGPSASLMGIDKDPEAIAVAKTLAEEDPRFSIEHGSFAEIGEFVRQRGWEGKLDGVLLDLGVSSPQLDDASRGFSFLNDGPLDMRMDTTRGESAAEWVARAGEKEIADVLKTYGEERFAKRMARAIVTARSETPITTTRQLAKIVADAHPRWEKHKHPATRAFQAIRIQVNQELADLERCLDEALEVLRPGGRLVVISFHSLEDRIVKRFIRKHVKGDEDIPPGLPVTDEMLKRRLQAVGKAVRAGSDEVEDNIRSRSAIMRVAEKLK